MKNFTRIMLAFALSTSIAQQTEAQDPSFSQFYANPLYLNPAFAGSEHCIRTIFNYRNQWPALTGQFVTTSASFDKYVCHLGGVGLLLTNDRAGENTIITNNASAIYSYIHPLNRYFSISAGFQATYAEKRVDWSKLTFGDMIDPRRGFVMQTNEVPGNSVARYFDMSAGGLLYSRQLYIGFAAHHLTQPDEHLQTGPSPLPRKYTVHAGTVIKVGESDHGEDVTISPNILYQQQQNFRELNLGLYVTRGPITGGFWYRNSDAFIILIGVQQGLFKLGYSYDVTVSKLSNRSAGSHEISVQMVLACKKCRKAFRTVSCPSF
ncbi:MAG TPA: type IX secretion system membrane protein PorP/SprF [Bacteroidia bacterium]|jgi:type IX secretion system PorP/SprF family membrane protein